MINQQILSIFNNAKVFLSDEEMKELALHIDNEIGKNVVKKASNKKELEKSLLASQIERLQAKQFRPNKRNK